MDNSTAATAGELIGYILACAPMFLVGLLFGIFFKAREPDDRALPAAFCAWGVFAVLAGFGFRNPVAGLFYVPAGIIVFFLLRGHYRKRWIPDGE